MVLKDISTAEKDGISFGTGPLQKFWPIILGNKGDWSYLVSCLLHCLFDCVYSAGLAKNLFWQFKTSRIDPLFLETLIIPVVPSIQRVNPFKVSSANLERSYRRAPKGPGEDDGGGLGVEGAGVCHLCLCGQGVDWEDLWPV